MRVHLNVDGEGLRWVAETLANTSEQIDADEFEDVMEPAEVVLEAMKRLEDWLVDYRAAVGALVG